MSTRRDGLHSLTYIHYGGAEALYAPNSTPSPCKTVAWTSQLSSSHVLPIHRRSDSRPTWRPQANLARTSKQLLTPYGVLARASRARRPWAPFFNHSNISHAWVCAWVWSSIWSWSAEKPRSLCTGDAPAPHKRAAVIETVWSSFKCMPGTPGHGLTGLSMSKFSKREGKVSKTLNISWRACYGTVFFLSTVQT